MTGTTVTVTAQDGGQFNAYVARPAAAQAPAIVVIQEIFGVNKVMRDICDGLAAQGYLAICPDLFWRQEPGVDITDQSEAEWQKAFSLYQGFDAAKGIEDIEATRALIAADAGSSGKVGAVGYCLGGFLAYMTACKTPIDAAIGYYGVGIDSALDAAGGIAKPLMLHIAEKDGFVPPEAQEKIKAALGGNGQVTLHSYAGQDHAFARLGGAHYDSAAAGLANQRSLDFFKDHLA